MSELIRVCCQCQKQLGIRPKTDETHSFCRVHWLATMVQLMPESQAIARADTIETLSGFPPCLMDTVKK